MRALSSCYVERRSRLASGAALETAGKRAAFALYYAPLHYLLTREIVRSIPAACCDPAPDRILDIGCGTGAAGAAWAIESGARVTGIDRHPWAVAEANWTYREAGVDGRALRADAARAKMVSGRRAAILAAFTVNELSESTRSALLPRLLDAHASGARVLIVEPIARRLVSWWDGWSLEVERAGGEAREWRFDVPFPPTQRQLGRAAGLNARELTARTFWLGP